VMAIPPKKADTRLVRHLTVEEMHAILNAPEPSGWNGLRDRALPASPAGFACPSSWACSSAT
jgi:site-specific recombinase XerD